MTTDTITISRATLEQLVEPLAWVSCDGMRAITNAEREAWIEAGRPHLVETYTIPAYTAAPAPQPAQDVPEVGFGDIVELARKAYPHDEPTWLPTCEEGKKLHDAETALIRAILQSAQPVAQPLPNPCHTCAHYEQGKRPGVSIHDETCYECSEYYANKWEAA